MHVRNARKTVRNCPFNCAPIRRDKQIGLQLPQLFEKMRDISPYFAPVVLHRQHLRIELRREESKSFRNTVHRGDAMTVLRPKMICELYQAHLRAADRKRRKYVQQLSRALSHIESVCGVR